MREGGRRDKSGHDEWGKPENWSGGWLGIYSDPRDPRVWVPKRNPMMGWTLNFAHRRAWVWLVAIAGIPLLLARLTIATATN